MRILGFWAFDYLHYHFKNCFNSIYMYDFRYCMYNYMYKFKLNCIKKSKLYHFLIEISLNVDNCWKFTENVFQQKAKLVKNNKNCWKMLKCWKMLIRKLIFFDTNNFLFWLGALLISILVFPIKPHYMKLLLHASTQIQLSYLRICILHFSCVPIDLPTVVSVCMYIYILCTYSTSIGTSTSICTAHT